MQTVPKYRTPLIAALVFCILAISGSSQTPETPAGEISRCWFYPLAETSLAISAAADANQVYLAETGGKLEAVSRSGRKVWSADLGGAISSNALATGSSVVLVTTATGPDGAGKPDGNGKREAVLRSISKETGITQWTVRIAEADRHFLHAYNGWIAVVSTNGIVSALDANGGRTIWRREIASGFIGKPAFSATKVAVATTSNQIFTISLLNGEIEGIQKIALPASSLLWATDGAVIAGDERGNITSIKIDAERPNWRFKSGGQVASLLHVGNDLVAFSYDNFIYSLDERNGDVNWKRRLSGRVSHAAKIGDHYIWVSALDDNGVIVIDSRNGKVVGQVSFGENEKLMSEPVIAEDTVVTVTNKGAYGYSTAKCANGEEGNSGLKPAAMPSINNLSSKTVTNGKRRAAASWRRSHL